MSDIESNAKEAMVLNLDVGDLDAASKLLEEIGDYFGYVKIGSELYAESGAEAVHKMRDLGYKVFLDLKLHDIPNTVERASRAHAKRGISMMTVHSSGGKEMIEAARRGSNEGAATARVEAPILLGVTILTSLPADDELFAKYVGYIADCGIDMVCSAHEIQRVKQMAPKVRMLVPGIRLAGQDANDQTRVATPFDAISAGASWIALGRAVYAADKPLEAAKQVQDEVIAALAQRPPVLE